ncbi:hypothetical protein BaRGS_00018124 [Batillaria attramentaria]|uniref:Uncharacterized protein n=1 Tax=Batillaria attramentaria TaxID=370345 RepID=A0ABD0KVA9_9CAEN
MHFSRGRKPDSVFRFQFRFSGPRMLGWSYPLCKGLYLPRRHCGVEIVAAEETGLRSEFSCEISEAGLETTATRFEIWDL